MRSSIEMDVWPVKEFRCRFGNSLIPISGFQYAAAKPALTSTILFTVIMLARGLDFYGV